MIHCVYSVMNAFSQPEFFDDVTRHYAKVLQELPDAVLTELAAFVVWMKEKPLHQSLLKEKSLALWWHQALFQEFLAEHPSQDLTLRTLQMLSDNKRLDILADILNFLSESRRPDFAVYWHAAKLFSDTELAHLTKTLHQAFGMPITIYQKEKPELLLGGVLLWGDTMIDLSLSAMLSNLYTEIDHVFTCS